MAERRKARLGRGLDGLLPAAPAKRTGTAAIEELHRFRGQPRTRFDEAALEELAESMRVHGVLEPIVVRTRKAGGYEIIAGERRWRAAQKAGLKQVPIHVRELDDRAAFEAALVENLQREDLNAVETARALHRLVEQHGHTQEQVAQRIGKDRSTVANAIRLLKLPEVVLEMVEAGDLSEGHGRALLRAKDAKQQLSLARQAARGGLSVRELERRARKQPSKAAPKKGKSSNVRDLERRLSRALGSPVSLSDRGGKGSIEIRYASWDELDRLIAALGA
ncbi:MAG: ParB/RepB/Spo0J family partition protein [Deltaproteobacteria bacterium]|nr:ParB/RepB/Spo0J family partition protein [Deltaproteobacteria bacterium]